MKSIKPRSFNRLDLNLQLKYAIEGPGRENIENIMVPLKNRYLLRGFRFRYTSQKTITPAYFFLIHNFLDDFIVTLTRAGQECPDFSASVSMLFQKDIHRTIKRKRELLIQRLYGTAELQVPILYDEYVNFRVTTTYPKNELEGDRLFIGLFGYDERAV